MSLNVGGSDYRESSSSAVENIVWNIDWHGYKCDNIKFEKKMSRVVCINSDCV